MNILPTMVRATAINASRALKSLIPLYQNLYPFESPPQNMQKQDQRPKVGLRSLFSILLIVFVSISTVAPQLFKSCFFCRLTSATWTCLNISAALCWPSKSLSENVGSHSAQVLRIANQCPVAFGFQSISARVIELYLVGSEVPYIKRACICVCRGERETDRQVCTQSVCLIRCDGSLVGTSPAFNTYRWLSSLTLLLNEGLCSLVSHTDMHTKAHTNTDMCLHFYTLFLSDKHGQTNTLAWTWAPQRPSNASTSTYRCAELCTVGQEVITQTHTHTIVRWQCPLLRRAEPLTDHWNFF